MKNLHKYVWLLAASIAIVLLTNCEEKDLLKTEGTISGTVTNAFSNNPVKGASVSITGSNETIALGDDGKFSFEAESNDNGYTIEVLHSDFELGKKVNVKVVAGEDVKADIVLEPIIPIILNVTRLDLGAADQESGFKITNTSTSEVSFSIQNTADWVSVTPESGTVGSQNGEQIKVTVDRTSLTNGDHEAELTINVPERGNVGLKIFVSKLDASSALLSLDNSALDFGKDVQTRTLTISNVGKKTLDWSLDVDQDWIAVNEIIGSIVEDQDIELTVFVSRGDLANGDYAGNIIFESNGGTGSVTVTMEVTDGGENTALLSVNQVSLDFGEEDETKSLTITNNGNRELDWTLSVNQSWIEASSTEGQVNVGGSSQDINITVSRIGLEKGNHTGLITLSGNGGTQTVTVVLEVPDIDEAVLEIDYTSLTFGEDGESRSIILNNIGNINLDWSMSSDKSWLSLSNSNGSIIPNTTTEIFVYVDRTELDNGDYSGTVSLTSNGGNESISVTMTVLGGANDQDADGVTDDVDADDDNNGLIEIRTINDLHNIRNDLGALGTGLQGGSLSGFTGYELMNDLDFTNSADYNDLSLKPDVTSGDGWEPIGTSKSNSFATMFEGNGFTIKKLLIDRTSPYNGVFAYTNNLSTIQNLHIEIKYLSGANYTAGLVGYNKAGKISNCSVSGRVVGYNYVGLLIGGDEDGVITSCFSIGEVIGNDSIGGLVGDFDSKGQTALSFSYSIANVKGDKYVGGLLGTTSNDSEISSCYAMGNITATDQYSGGLVGYLHNGAEVNSCYATGKVASSSSYVGGLVGWVYGSILTSYSTGSVEGTSSLGGVVGGNSGSVSSSNYWDTNKSGIDTSAGAATGQSTASLQGPTEDNGIYITWSADVWDFGTSTQYPALKNMPGGLAAQGR